MSFDVHKAELQPGAGQLGQRQATHGGRADALDAVERATQRSSSTSRFMAMMGSVVPRSRSGALVLIRHYFTSYGASVSENGRKPGAWRRGFERVNLGQHASAALVLSAHEFPLKNEHALRGSRTVAQVEARMFPIPAHQTERADFRHAAFRSASPQGPRWSAALGWCPAMTPSARDESSHCDMSFH